MAKTYLQEKLTGKEGQIVGFNAEGNAEAQDAPASLYLDSIIITKAPTKTTYTAGDVFNPAGMEVQAKYTNGTVIIATVPITGYAFLPATGLVDGTTSVTIQYTEGGITKTASQAVTVIHRLESISVTTKPNVTTYEYQENLNTAGMVVTAAYSDGSTAAVSGWSCSPTALNTVGTQAITVTYTEREYTRTTTFNVTVERQTISAVPSQSGTLTYTGSALSPSWTGYDSTKMTIGGDTVKTDAGSYNATFTPTANYRWSDGTTTAKTVAWSIGKAAGSLSLSPTSITVDTENPTATFTITRAGNGTISISNNATGICTATLSGNVVTVTGLASGSATITVNVAEGSNHEAPSSKTLPVTVNFVHIYGVEWDGTSTTLWSRTDDAAGFVNPSPAVNNGSGSSPFDNLLPWSGMVKETDSTAGVLVKIPKFWYKWTTNGSKLKLQIADMAADGFSVSPAHMDRGDGKGERDYVYIGRYHCASGYKSTTGAAQQTDITRSTARTGIHNLGSTYWQMDYAMRVTVWMLYLVEFADWNSQKVIGYGCSAGGSKVNNGQTDGMSYHTGTTAANRTTYGYTQYRNIEGLWDNVYDWMDGCYYNGNGLNIIVNPANFSDSSNGIVAGSMPSGGYPNAMKISAVSGLGWVLMPSSTGGSDSTYVPDSWYFDSSGPCLLVGGYYDQDLNRGLFCVYCDGSSGSNAGIGCRLQKLP